MRLGDRHWIESLKPIIELKHVRNFEMLGAGNVNFSPVGILEERVVYKDEGLKNEHELPYPGIRILYGAQ